MELRFDPAGGVVGVTPSRMALRRWDAAGELVAERPGHFGPPGFRGEALVVPEFEEGALLVLDAGLEEVARIEGVRGHAAAALDAGIWATLDEPASANVRVLLRDPAGADLLQIRPEHRWIYPTVNSLALTPDGRFLVTSIHWERDWHGYPGADRPEDHELEVAAHSTADGSRLWEVADASLLALDGTRAVLGSGGGARVVAVADGAVLEELEGPITAAALAGEHLALLAEGQIRCGSRTAEAGPDARALALAPGGTRAATGSSPGGELRLVDL